MSLDPSPVGESPCLTRLLLPCFLRLRAELLAPALPAAGRAHRVPRVAVHADHLEQETLLGLREPRHGEGGTPPRYLSNTLRAAEGSGLRPLKVLDPSRARGVDDVFRTAGRA